MNSQCVKPKINFAGHFRHIYSIVIVSSCMVEQHCCVSYNEIMVVSDDDKVKD